MTIKILYAGDTQVNVITSSKGLDTWSFTYYSDSAHYLRDALGGDKDIALDHIRASDVISTFPSTVQALQAYDAVIVSDLGYNNFAFQPGNIAPFAIPMGPDRVSAMREYVLQGGGFMMIGGWLSFSGLQGKGLFGGTKIEEVLPVRCAPRGVDDREEVTQGFTLELNQPDHPIVKGLPWHEPYMLLGYNKVTLAPGAQLVASYHGDPLIATCQVGRGRTVVFTSDVGPHWAGSWLHWSGYAEFWRRIIKWAGGQLGQAAARPTM